MIHDSQTLLRLRGEFQGFLSGSARELREGGLAAAPLVVLSMAKCLAWNSEAFDSQPALHPAARCHGPTIAMLAADIIAAAMPLCPIPTPAPRAVSQAARVAALEAEITLLRNVLANRKGEVL